MEQICPKSSTIFRVRREGIRREGIRRALHGAGEKKNPNTK
jgi:hypothetical protein